MCGWGEGPMRLALTGQGPCEEPLRWASEEQHPNLGAGGTRGLTCAS